MSIHRYLFLIGEVVQDGDTFAAIVSEKCSVSYLMCPSWVMFVSMSVFVVGDLAKITMSSLYIVKCYWASTNVVFKFKISFF